MSDSESETKPYYHLTQGDGAVFILPWTKFSIWGDIDYQSIGTSGCQVCLCVYIPLTASRCFTARMVANIAPYEGPNEVRAWCPTYQQGVALKDFVKNLLGKLGEFKEIDWSAEAVKSRAEETIVCCPRLTWDKQGNQPATGTYILEAIREFFDMPKLEVRKGTHGFVVDHLEKQCRVLEHKDKLRFEPEDWDWQRVNKVEPDLEKEIGPWSFTFDGQKWMQSKDRAKVKDA